jgi:hypothetical protein
MVSSEGEQGGRAATGGPSIDSNGSVSDGDSSGDRNSGNSIPWAILHDTIESVSAPLPHTPDDRPILRSGQRLVAPSVQVFAPRIPCTAQFHAFGPIVQLRLSPSTYRVQTWDESLGEYVCARKPKSFEDEARMQAAVGRIDAAERARRREVTERHERIIFAAAERSVRDREGRDEMGQGTRGDMGGERGFVKVSSVAARRAVVDLLVQQGGEGWRAELEAKIGVVGDEQDSQRTRIRAELKRCVEGVKEGLRKFFSRG